MGFEAQLTNGIITACQHSCYTHFYLNYERQNGLKSNFSGFVFRSALSIVQVRLLLAFSRQIGGAPKVCLLRSEAQRNLGKDI